MHIVHSLHEGGVERLLLDLCRKIDKQKFEIQVCCVAEKGALFSVFQANGIKVHFLGAKRDLNFVNILSNVRQMFALAGLLRKENIDITHGHEFFSTVFSRISAVLARVKFRIITLHNIYSWWGKGVHFSQRMLSLLTDYVICNSKATYLYSLEHDRIRKDKYRLIYNGIDTDEFSKEITERHDFEKEFSLSPEQYVCMNVGNISRRKGQEYLIKAANELKTEFPELVYLLIGGKHHIESSDYDKVITLIEELDLGKIVHVTGKRSDVSRILNYCDLYLMPSTVEGFGLALAEAMSMEKTVVASDILPFREIVDDKVDGFLFKSEDYLDLARKIKEVLETDPNKLETVKSSARKKIISKFSSYEMVRHYEKLYQDVIVQ